MRLNPLFKTLLSTSKGTVTLTQITSQQYDVRQYYTFIIKQNYHEINTLTKI